MDNPSQAPIALGFRRHLFRRHALHARLRSKGSLQQGAGALLQRNVGSGVPYVDPSSGARRLGKWGLACKNHTYNSCKIA